MENWVALFGADVVEIQTVQPMCCQFYENQKAFNITQECTVGQTMIMDKTTIGHKNKHSFGTPLQHKVWVVL